jgi:RNA polymerase sigma-70 factor (ECF subfamily)
MVDTTVELFEKAVRLHTRRLLTIARAVVGYRASPEDVVQQAVMNLYKHRERYDWREAGGLLRRAVVNEAVRLLRQPKMSMVVDDHPGEYDTPDASIEDRETIVRVRAAIDKLPPHFKTALVLCEYENLSYQQIADTMGATVPQVKTWIFRARRKLEEMLKDYVEGNRPKTAVQKAAVNSVHSSSNRSK